MWNFSGVYNLADLQKYFASLQDALSGYTSPVSLRLTSGDQTVTVSLQQPADQMVQTVLSAFSTNNIAVFATEIIVNANDNSATLQEAIKNWKESAEFKQLHKFSNKSTVADSHGQRWIHAAAQSGDIQAMEGLLTVHLDLVSDKVNPNIPIAETGDTPLHLAASKDHSKVVELLLQQEDIDLHRKNIEGYNALHFAARNGCINVVPLLLLAGMDINECCNGQSALDLAEQYHQTAMIKLLRENGAYSKTSVVQPNRSFLSTTKDFLSEESILKINRELSDSLARVGNPIKEGKEFVRKVTMEGGEFTLHTNKLVVNDNLITGNNKSDVYDVMLICFQAVYGLGSLPKIATHNQAAKELWIEACKRVYKGRKWDQLNFDEFITIDGSAPGPEPAPAPAPVSAKSSKNR